MFDEVITIDFESRSACDLKNCGAWVYSEHPTTEVLCLWFVLPDGSTFRWLPGDPIPDFLLQSIASGAVFECHSSMFERGMWLNIMVKQWGWPEIPDEQWHDTQAVCARKALPLDLEKVSGLLGLKVEKNKAGSEALKKICKPTGKKFEYNEDPALLELVTGDYGRDDVLAQSYLSKRIGYLEPVERDIWLLNQRMNLRGLRIDLDFAADCQAVYDEAAKPLLDRFLKETDGIKAGSHVKIREFVNSLLPEDGQKFDDMRKDTVEEALRDWDVPDYARDIILMRGGLTSSSVSKLRAMRDSTAADGRSRGLVQYHAATTGRDGGRLIQPQNFPRGTVDCGRDLDGKPVPPQDFLVPAIQSRDTQFIGTSLAYLYDDYQNMAPDIKELLAPIAAVTSSLRHCLVPDKDKLFCAGDFNTIEVRVLLGVAGQHDKLKLLREGLDPYLDFANDVEPLALTGDTKHDKAVFHKERQEIGKPGVLGCGFQMGAPKLWRKDGKGRWGLETAERIVQAYRQDWAPKVPELWYGLQEAALKAVWDRRPQEYNGIRYYLEDGFLICHTPADTKLYYYNPRTCRRHMPWSTEEKPDIREGWRYQTMKQGRLVWVDAYGGLQTENVVQHLARVIMYNRALILDANGFPLVLTVHDENVTEPDRANADEAAMTQIMEAATDIDWVKALGIPIAAECWVGDRYKK